MNEEINSQSWSEYRVTIRDKYGNIKHQESGKFEVEHGNSN